MTLQVVGPVFPIPANLYFVLTTACNLQCKQCFLWSLSRPNDHLEEYERLALIAQFHAVNPHGRVVLTGGEPLLMHQQVLNLTTECRRLGLCSVVNTNGTIGSKELIIDLCERGPDQIVVSLESTRAEVHDFARNAAGTYEKVTTFIKELVRKRADRRSHLKIFVHAFVYERNYTELTELVEFVRALSIDGIRIQLLRPSFALRARDDAFFREESCRNKRAAKEALLALAERYLGDPFLITSEEDLRLMAGTLDDRPGGLAGVCASGERNIMVDMRGEVQLCFNMKSLSGGRPIGNVREADLGTLWASDRAREMRSVMRSCERPCGLLSCHRRTSHMEQAQHDY